MRRLDQDWKKRFAQQVTRRQSCASSLVSIAEALPVWFVW
jgi:hypothetical protein